MAEREEHTPDASPKVAGSKPPPPPTVVGIGASAGGLAALQGFFEKIPEDSGLAFVVVVHLNPEHESHLADLLQPYVRAPVQQVTETVPLVANRVYVIPPNANLSAVDTHLRLSRLEHSRHARAPIDHFFRTLASTYDGRSVGVILTGTGSDGSLGIKAIKEKSGFTVVQEPADAEYDGMPQSAISTGLVDRVLPLAQIPEAVLRFARTQPRVVVPADGGDVEGEQRRLLQKIFTHVRARTGRDFSRYKRSTLLRRIQRRMQIRHLEEIGSYLDLLREDSNEVRDLADDILITVTNFFRDPAVWAKLEKEVLPRILAARGPADGVRVWCVGCATGEEAYSLAMLLAEEASRRNEMTRIQVFASDLHEPSLEKAREGFYPGDIDAEVSPERLRRFFQQEDGGYRVRKEVRDMLVFAPHNVLSDPPFSRIDLISCRNLMIYLQPDVQREVLELFHYALNPDGALVLGTSETVDDSNLFRTESKDLRIYRKRNIKAPEPRLPVFPLSRIRARGDARRQDFSDTPLAYGLLHQKLLEQYAPPSILVAPDGRIVHLSEGAGRYLMIPGGEPTTSAHKLVREELRIELRTALHSAREKKAATRSKPIAVRLNGETTWVVVDVRPAGEPEQEGFVLVVFEERGAAESKPPVANPDGGENGRVQELETELEQTRERLQAIVEEYETSQEEMKASHEELQSANEELRSTLEELETSKEELQSMNEELQTVNQENRHKVEELSQLSSDLQNLLASTEIATLFLDRELRILRFTPQVSELFNVRPVDRGRPLFDLTNRLGYDELESDAHTVLRTLVPVEREVQDERERWFLTRVHPYRSREDRIEGVVITFIDITDRKGIETELRQLNETLEQRVEERTGQVREQEERLRTLVETAALMVWTTDASGEVVEDSPSWRAFTGQSVEQWMGTGWAEAVHPDDRTSALERWRHTADQGIPLDTEFRLWHAQSGSWRWTNARAVPVRDQNDEVREWVWINLDVDERRRAETDRREVLRQLVTTEEDERRRISRELHDQMGQQVTGLLLGLRALRREATDPELAQRAESLERLTAEISRDMQHLALQLRPPALDTLGLVAAVQSHLEDWGERHGIEHDFHAIGLQGMRLSAEIETTMYRMVQEALTNVLKHAGASRVSLTLERRGRWVRGVLEDNGSGFDVEQTLASGEKAKRLGLRGMRERVALLGGELSIEASPGSGTTVYLRIPIAPREDGADG